MRWTRIIEYRAYDVYFLSGLDNDKHHKPHIHVYYGEYEVSIGIDGELLSGSIPVKKLRLVQAWIILHEEELYKE